MGRTEAKASAGNKSGHGGPAETEPASLEDRLAEAERFARLGHWEWNFGSGTGVWSEGMFSIFEVDRDEVIEDWEPFLNKIHADDRSVVDLASKALIDGGTRQTYDYRIVLNDGSLRYIHSESEVTRDNEGRVIRFFGITQDVTELRQAELRERERNAELESVFQALPDLYFRIAADGTILDYRANHTSDLYVTPDQFLGKRMQDVLPPQIGRQFEERIGRIIRSSRMETTEFTLPINGTDQHFEARHVPLDDKQIISVVRNITKRKMSEQYTNSIRARLTKAEQVAGLGHWHWNLENDERSWSKGMYELYGVTPGNVDFSWRSILNRMHPEDRDRMDAYVKKALKGGSESSTQYRVVRPDGSVRLLHGQWEISRDSAGRATEFFGVAQDITERNQAEIVLRESEKLAATGRMAARIAHEINNPLAGITNSFQLVKDAVPNDHEDRDFVELIERELKRITAIVRQMYQLYRVETPAPQPFALIDAVNDVCELLSSSLRGHSLVLQKDIASDLPLLKLPRNNVHQILFSLVQNAIEASEDGKEIMLGANMRDGMVWIDVTDHGRGVEASLISEIFEPFFTTKRGHDSAGMGLGLSVSDSLARSMGGRIECKTEPGKGSTFSIVLPTEIVEGADSARDAEPQKDESKI